MGRTKRPAQARDQVWRSAALKSASLITADALRGAITPARKPSRYLPHAAFDPLEPRCLLTATPLISEFLATNNIGIVDEDLDHSDWLELHNPGGNDVNLGGYFLSDDHDNLTKWQLPAVTLPSGGYLTIFADGKNRKVIGSNLHTSFSISEGGGFLALVAPNGSDVLSSYNYPQQVADISYGVPVLPHVTTLIAPAAAARTLVPTSGILGATWTGLGFNDAAWPVGPTGIGYDTETPILPTGGFTVRMVDTAGGTDGSISDIGEATKLLDGTTVSGAFTIAANLTASRNSINFGGGGSYANDLTYPNGLGATAADNGVAGRTQYALRITANVTIPAGQYTINAFTDDGFRLRIPGVTFTNRMGENFTGATNPSPADTLVYGAPRSGNTLATFTVPTGGLTTTLTMDQFEQSGADGVELSLATGLRTAFNTTNFALLTDGLYGWAVKDPSSTPPPNYRSIIGANTQSQMLGINNSAYVRVPFTVSDPDDFDEARFQIKYDDGFVAYVNGVEFARRNAPGTPVWNSSASGLHDDAAALKFESFSIPTSMLVEGQNVLAIQGLNSASDTGDFLIYPTLQGLFTTTGAENYFTTPTPGAVNGAASSLGFVDDTKFNVKRGFYTAPFQLTIASDTPGATIRYTLDGTAPTAAGGLLYTGPINVSSTTTVRAAAYKPGLQPSNIDTQSYFFMADVITQAPTGTAPPNFPTGPVNGQILNYGMDPSIVNTTPGLAAKMQTIPTVSIVMDPNDLFNATTGFYTHPASHGRAWERATSVEFLYPDGTKENLQSNAGIRVRGGYSRNVLNPKHGFHLYFRSEYGDGSFDAPIFGPGGANTFNQFDLRTFNNYSWSYGGDSRFIGLRDQFSRDTQLAMGWQAERGDFYNLYINGQFWGIYNSDERAEADYGASYFGGAKEDYDVVKVASDVSYTIEATDGNLDAWTSLYTQAQGDMTVAANYQKLLGNNPDGTRNSTYPVLLDPKNLIDYMLTIYYTGNLDAPLSNFLGNNSPNNWFALRNRNGDLGFQFFAHDSEHTLLDVNQDRTGDVNGVWPITNTTISKSNPQWLFQMLVANPDFKQAVGDRIQKAFFDGGTLTPAAVSARLTVRKNQIDQAIYGESARWGDSKRTPAYTHATWQTEIDRIFNSYIPTRSTIVLNQLKARGWFPTVSAPTYSKFGGVVSPGFNLTMANPNGTGTLYYTLDGSDPRLLGGGLSPSALVYTSGNITINQTRTIRARVLSTGTWSSLEDATFTLDSSALHITEVMYNPALPPAGSPYIVDDFEFVELFNGGATTVDMSGMKLDKGILVTFAGGTSLAAGARGVVVKNVAAFQSRYGTSIQILGTFTDKLSDGGEQVRLVTAGGLTIVDFTYVDSWYGNTDGGGYSLVARNPLASNATLAVASGWRPSNDLNGKPGFVDLGVNPGSIVINEAMANPEAGDDWIELRNTTNAAIDIGGWFLSDSAADLRKYQIPLGTIIPANGFLMFYAGATFGVAGNPGVATAFGLGADGDSIHFSSIDTLGNAGGYQEEEDFSATDSGVTVGRYTNAAGTTRFVALLTPTPSGTNSGPKPSKVVINELMYFPTTGQEFIELRNLSVQPAPLYDPENPNNRWMFTNGIDFIFPAGATIPGLGYALVVGGDPVAFRTQFNVPAAVPIWGGYIATDGTNVLANGGERVTISRPVAPDLLTGIAAYQEVDSVEFDDVAPWPTSPRGLGPSLSRASGLSYGDTPGNWFAGPTGGTPGAANLTNTTPTIATISSASISEGGTYTANGAFFDADPDPDESWSATVDYGDGTGPQPLTLIGKTFALNHVYADNSPAAPGYYVVTVKVTDISSAVGTGQAAVIVSNVAPTLSISGASAATVGTTYTLNLARLTEPGQDTITSWTIDWGTGTPEVIAGNPASVTHLFTTAGSTGISATATDEDGTYNAGNALTVNVVAADTTAPTITSWSSAGTHGQGVGEALLVIPDDGTFTEPRLSGISSLLISFSEAIAPGSLAPSGVGVWGIDIDGNPVSLAGITFSTSTRSGNTIGVITFSQKLPDYARYLIRLTGVADVAGNPLAGDNTRIVTALLGDATGDGRINSTDLGGVTSLRGIDPIDPSVVNQVRSDVTNDGRINGTDLGGITSVRGRDARFIPDPVAPAGDEPVRISLPSQAPAEAVVVTPESAPVVVMVPVAIPEVPVTKPVATTVTEPVAPVAKPVVPVASVTPIAPVVPVAPVAPLQAKPVKGTTPPVPVPKPAVIIKAPAMVTPPAKPVVAPKPVVTKPSVAPVIVAPPIVKSGAMTVTALLATAVKAAAAKPTPVPKAIAPTTALPPTPPANVTKTVAKAIVPATLPPSALLPVKQEKKITATIFSSIRVAPLKAAARPVPTRSR